MMGPSADGSGFVNINNKCRGCGARMPLPASHGKYCPDCGTRVPTWDEMQGAVPAQAGPPAVCCPKCGAKERGKFCTRCGTEMPVRCACGTIMHWDACTTCGARRGG